MKLRVGIVILAAGESSRLGQPKQLLPFRGKTLIEHVVDSALKSRLRPIIVVLGANAEQIRPKIFDEVRIVENPHWKEGMASSIRCGIEAIKSDIDAVILMLCDQPLITAEILNRLAENEDASLAAAEYDGTIGVPALFSREFFADLRNLQGKEGAKKILLANETRIVRIACGEAAMDVDTMADVQRLQSFE